MLSRYNKSITRLLLALRRFEENPKDLLALGSLQTDIYRVLCRVETARNRLKRKATELKKQKRHGRLPKNESLKLKRQIEILKSHISRYGDTIYLLRAIGDGIAFSIFDKWDLKPLHFKEDAGNLTGKIGVIRERKMLKHILANGVPAVHCDITNVIRYGDVCVEIHSFPFLIEVKSSDNKNERVDRQIEAIQKIHNYYGTDEIEGLYGAPKTFRASPRNKEKEYSEEINRLIDRSRKETCAWQTVEKGLVYIVMRKFDDAVFEKITKTMLRPVICVLNPEKFTGTWSSYRPYTISIRDVDSLKEFIFGEYTIVIIYDEAVIDEHAIARGYRAERVGDAEECPLEFVNIDQYLYRFDKVVPESNNEGVPAFYSSTHFFGRAFFEFVSIKWLVDSSLDNISDSLANMADWPEYTLEKNHG